MKDGGTVFVFSDAKDLRRLMHDRPGQKPEGGKPVYVQVFYRDRDERGAYTGQSRPGGATYLRFIDKHTVAWVEQDATTQDDRPARES
jgi:hypothetical protein